MSKNIEKFKLATRLKNSCNRICSETKKYEKKITVVSFKARKLIELENELF